jgi:hypothetical protein
VARDGSRKEKEAYLELLDDMDVFEIGNAIREKSTLEAGSKKLLAAEAHIRLGRRLGGEASV